MTTQPSRRELLTGLAAGAAPFILRSQSSARPPNVVFLICDQMRGDALSLLGSPNARTPNLDRLAAGGVAFVNHTSNNPVCLPSRKSMFSGLYPHQHGSLANHHGKPMPVANTMLEYFKQRGYRTGYVGKNHTYDKEAIATADFVKVRDREPFRQYNRWVPPEWHTDTYWPAEECHAWLNTADALQFIDGARDRNPFFLTVSYFDPHPPNMAPPEYSSKYHSDQMKIPPFIAPSKLSGRLDDYCRAMKCDRIKDAALTETMRYYYASIEGMVDYQVGRIMNALGSKGLLENTIIAFTADHGDFMGQHRLVRKGMFLYDCLLHVPMLWHIPGTRGGRQSKALTQGIDIFPTLVDLTGGKLPRELPGRSLKPLFASEPNEPDRAIFTGCGYAELPRETVEEHKNSKEDPDTPLHSLAEEVTSHAEHRSAMARTRDWKFIQSESRPPELYRMDGGWIERENLAGRPENAAIRRSLEQRVQSWWKW
jgi:arylsulfatase A-like enzyme